MANRICIHNIPESETCPECDALTILRTTAIQNLVNAVETELETCDYCCTLGYTCKVHLKTALALSDYKAVTSVQ